MYEQIPGWYAAPLTVERTHEGRYMLENQAQGDIGSFVAWVIIAAAVGFGVWLWRKRKG